MPSGANSRCTCSVPSSASYWRVRHASVAVRMRSKSSTDSGDELDADRQPSLQLGNQVRRLRQVKRARRDEQDVVGLDHPVLRRDRRAFDERQQVALHALARHVGAVRVGARGDLVDLVDEDDAVLLGRCERARLDVVVVDRASPASSSVSCFSASGTFIRLTLRRPPPICWNMPWICDVRSSMPGRRHDLHLRRRHRRSRRRCPCRRAGLRAASCGISGASPNRPASCRRS